MLRSHLIINILPQIIEINNNYNYQHLWHSRIQLRRRYVWHPVAVGMRTRERFWITRASLANFSSFLSFHWERRGRQRDDLNWDGKEGNLNYIFVYQVITFPIKDSIVWPRFNTIDYTIIVVASAFRCLFWRPLSTVSECQLICCLSRR